MSNGLRVKGPKRLDRPPIEPAPPDRINAWICERCGEPTVCIDVHVGVTPFLLDCRATKDCKGLARSCFYPGARPIPERYATPRWEWYAPDDTELRELLKKNPQTAEHVMQGGLLIRERRADG